MENRTIDISVEKLKDMKYALNEIESDLDNYVKNIWANKYWKILLKGLNGIIDNALERDSYRKENSQL